MEIIGLDNLIIELKIYKKKLNKRFEPEKYLYYKFKLNKIIKLILIFNLLYLILYNIKKKKEEFFKKKIIFEEKLKLNSFNCLL